LAKASVRTEARAFEVFWNALEDLAFGPRDCAVGSGATRTAATARADMMVVLRKG
jgi:hypothetical protein